MGMYDINGQILFSENIIAEDKNSVELWESGRIWMWNGSLRESSAYARTKNTLSSDIACIQAQNGVKLMLYAFQGNTFKGFLTSNNTLRTEAEKGYETLTSVDLSEVRKLYPAYTFKLDMTNIDGRDITSMSECVDMVRLITEGEDTAKKIAIPSTIIIAAHNSTAEDKRIADFVCDGVNDEIEIQKALDHFSETSGTVILCNGNYNIDSLYDTGNAELGKFGLYISKSSVNHSVIIRGMNHPNRVKTYGVGVAPTLRLSDEVYDALADDEKVTILGALPTDLSNPSRTYPNLNLTIENLAINIKGNQKSTIMIDGTYCSNMRIDYFMCSPDSDQNTAYNGTGTDFKTTPNEGCIGIRTLLGQNFGTGYYINNCFIWGMYVAYDIGGEHLIAQNCGCRLCYYSFRFNGFGKPNANSHPLTLINCCEESCKASMYFCSASVKQSVNIVDYNLEIRNSEGAWGRERLAVEEVAGSFCGNITFLANNEDYVNRGNIAFWETGSGIDILTRNLAHKSSGTTSERPTAPNLNQQYFDTTLNKMIVYVDGSWVDMMGVSV